MSAVVRLQRITLNCAAPQALARFYAAALGFEQIGTRTISDPAFAKLLDLPSAEALVVAMRLGEQELDLMRVEPQGRPYPGDVPGTNGLFQHFAIEVADMDRAVSRLRACPGWTAISVGGPQKLPEASGGVIAFKFRDPEGHPLELITAAQPRYPLQTYGTPGAVVSRIGHSALSVASTARSSLFYDTLGLSRTGGSLNVGPEQERLDGIPDVSVTVTALSVPTRSGPHVELLCYGDQFVPASPASKPNDIAAAWLVFKVSSESDLISLLHQTHAASRPIRFCDGIRRTLLPDPDGHWLCLEACVESAQPPVAKPG